ncbi:MAG: U32 family peptidase [Bacteroidales bacterium]|nr:U32 family peptidase [Bacteroidales bacterium]
MRKIELLAPAKNAEIGKEAFNHGADAVYIGAPRFSARAAAGNDIKDIEALASYGHLFGAKTFIAFNTLLRNEELPVAEDMAWKLYEAGADALIIQDLGLLKLNLPPIELHASTQTDNRTIEKVRLMHQLGIKRVVLARELSVEQIREIHNAVPDVELECFVHGALCVCVSGQCYLSAAINGRSANRGECAQPCRLPMDLTDANGRRVVTQKHLLSLKDMNRSALLEDLIDAGVTSLKIEGRLKDMNYVKNVTSFYRKKIDNILEHHQDWEHISEGKVYYNFEPAVEKSFNRGFTEYQNNRESFWNFETPKSVGEYIGRIGKVTAKGFEVIGKSLANGDGIMIGTIGTRVNKVENGIVFPLSLDILKSIKSNMEVWRNLDYRFEQSLEKPTAKRKIEVDISLCIENGNAMLSLSDGTTSVSSQRGPFENAEKPQEENYKKQLTKLGETIFEVRNFTLMNVSNKESLFIPSSVLSEMRREVVSQLLEKRAEIDVQRRHSYISPNYPNFAKQLDANDVFPHDFRANIMNDFAKEIMRDMNMDSIDDAFEIQQNKDYPVMITRHCLKYALGHCLKYKNTDAPDYVSTEKWEEPMTLNIGGRKFLLKFGCNNSCFSEIYLLNSRKK